MQQHVQSFVARVNEPRRWTYLVAAAPAALVALAGWEMGAAPMYMTVAVICAAQFAYPTRLGWWISFLQFAGATAHYLYLLAVDVVAWSQGGSRSMLLDLSDTVAYLIWVGLLVVTVVLLLMMKASRSLPEVKG
jgi:hypothetical protein